LFLFFLRYFKNPFHLFLIFFTITPIYSNWGIAVANNYRYKHLGEQNEGMEKVSTTTAKVVGE